MQTFLPYKSFEKSAQVLDYRRLGKQRVEAWQILNILLRLEQTPDEKIAWRNHPAVLMWKNYELALSYYGITICSEWIRRGYNDSLLPKFEKSFQKLWRQNRHEKMPNFSSSFYKSHKSNLLRKDKDWYGKFKWKVSDNLPYVWPKRKNEKQKTKEFQLR